MPGVAQAPATELTECGPDLWFVKSLFHLGAGQTEGLRYSGLRQRVIDSLGEDPLGHRALSPHPGQESTPAELVLEQQAVRQLLQGEDPAFELDTTMAVVRRSGSCEGPLLTLISPVECSEQLLGQIRGLGQVREIVVPSLQHWVFTEELIRHFPEARLLWAPPACGEDLGVKMPELADRAVLLENGCAQLGAQLEARLLEGAPLNMNEFVFFHSPSSCLITSDAFYGGHTGPTTWFQRLWFKLTKHGSFRGAVLPVYRTVRVKSHGSVKLLLACVDGMVADWQFTQILFAHGTNPYTDDASRAFSRAWHALEEHTDMSCTTDHSIKPVTAVAEQPTSC